MRGEHCVAGASILTAIAVILLVFANIGQLSSGAVTNGIYWAELNIEAWVKSPGGSQDIFVLVWLWSDRWSHGFGETRLMISYGNGLKAASKKDVPGLYNSKNVALGNSTGLRQYYRYGIYSMSPIYLSDPIHSYNFLISPNMSLAEDLNYLPSGRFPGGRLTNRRLWIPKRRIRSMQFNNIRIPLRTP